ncbi:hypothetical protein IQ06DRAFT_289100 [Phaeosphaeriaceae sp. SRC1lsM3a]|nr:hypothetical protein IQ06DRAFT_289100 [Stagonospora sp. SRC1lsM3a]
MSSSSLSEVLFQKIDGYVDSLAPEIQPRIASELELFQNKTIDSLETQVIDAFRSLFDKNKSDSSDRSLNDAPPGAYGGQSLPFADEISKLTQSFGKLSDGASDDLRDIFDLTERRDGPDQPRSQGSDFSGARGFLSSAIDAVQDHLENSNRGSGGQSLELGGLLGVISSTVKDASRNPEEKARLISPEIRDRVGEKLRSQHASIAEQFTKIALDHLKRWLRGNTSTRDIGDGAKGELEDHVKDLVKGIGGLFGKKSSSNESSRGIEGSDRDEGGSGFSKVISDKMSTGLARVHREVRIEFRKILGAIEKQLFELLPDQFQRPLEKILGGNPFDSQLDRDAGGQADRGFGDDIKAKLISKIRDLVRKVQETLRESILGVVNGGHRKLELESWVFVQNIVEQKVQRYLPDVKITVPDDIGNEGVSVGAPTTNTNIGGGGGTYSGPPPPQSYDHDTRPSSGGYGGGGHNAPPPQNYRNDVPPSGGNYSGHEQPQHGYSAPPPQYQDNQGYRNEPYQQHGYQSQPPPPQKYDQQHSSNYQSGGSYQQHDSYQQRDDHQPQGGYQQQGNYHADQPGGSYGQQDYRTRY